MLSNAFLNGLILHLDPHHAHGGHHQTQHAEAPRQRGTKKGPISRTTGQLDAVDCESCFLNFGFSDLLLSSFHRNAIVTDR